MPDNDSATIVRSIRLRIDAENMLALVSSAELDDLAERVNSQGWYYPNPKVDAAAAEAIHCLNGLREALATIVRLCMTDQELARSGRIT